jgi:ABC-type multidrug transport system permease subunit
MRQQIETICGSVDETKRLHFDSPFATSFNEQMRLMCSRVVRIYKRSPAYNLARLMISLFYSFIIGSIFLKKGGPRDIWGQNEIEAILGTMFLSLTVIGITSISMAVPVTKRIRDVFYKHRASGMLTYRSVYPALAAGETPYLCFISLLFGIVYYATVGLFSPSQSVGTFGMFWVFFTLNVAIYSYFGQAFICLVRDIPTSGALVGALVGYNIFFSGFVVNPQNFVGPFQLGLWTAPGRFAYEGLVMSQLHGVEAPVSAEYQSPYYFSLNCTGGADVPCVGNVTGYVQFTFGDKFTPVSIVQW